MLNTFLLMAFDLCNYLWWLESTFSEIKHLEKDDYDDIGWDNDEKHYCCNNRNGKEEKKSLKYNSNLEAAKCMKY